MRQSCFFGGGGQNIGELSPFGLWGTERAQSNLNFTVQKHWDLMCLFVHFLDLND